MRAHVVTFGCQMNEYDTHAIESELAGLGYSFVDDFREADLVLVNTCAVRGKPVEKAQTLLGELRKEKNRRKGLTIGLMGCLAQLPEGRTYSVYRVGDDLLLRGRAFVWCRTDCGAFFDDVEVASDQDLGGLDIPLNNLVVKWDAPSRRISLVRLPLDSGQ